MAEFRSSPDGDRFDREPPFPSENNTRLRRQIRILVARFCPRRLRDHIDDIVQVAWLRLDRAMKTSDRNRNPGTTLIARVAFCATMDECRRLRRRREVSLESNVDRFSAPTDEPFRATHAREIRRALQSCLMAMRENRSLAVTLYLQGHSAPETAHLLGWSVSKTENLIYRGLADLRRCLAAKGMTP